MAHVVRVEALDKVPVRIADRLLEVRRKLLHVLVAPVRALLTTFENDLVNAVRNFGIELSGRRHRFLNVLDRDRDRRITVKRHLSGQHFIERNAQRINIALLVAETSARLFRGSVMDRPHDIGGDRITGGRLGDSEISDLHLALAGDDDVLGLDVPVYDMVPVRRFKAHRDLQSDRHSFFIAQTSPLRYIILERDSVHKFHYDVVDSLLFAYIVNIDDIGMHEACRGLCFHSEFRNEIRVLRKLLLEYLYRNIAVECMIF